MIVKALDARTARDVVEREHYLHRKPPVSHAFGLYEVDALVGVCIFGVPGSRDVQKSVCPAAPDLALELNRLWVHDRMPRNTESWFVARCLALLPPRIVFSYADTRQGHAGYIYRALNFAYAGWTDMDRKTPRFDYIVPGKHSREAFRSGQGAQAEKVRRKPKHRYWITTGDRRARRRLDNMCGWPRMAGSAEQDERLKG